MLTTDSMLTTDQVRAWIDPPVWGMVHLDPLPGSPAYHGDPHRGLARALQDAGALVESGYRGVVVENYGDLPFFADRVPPVTVAGLSRVVGAIKQEWPELRVGVNCLRNDAQGALAVAAVHGADAIRVNVHVGAAVTDQGLIQGDAAATLRERQALQAGSVRIFADLSVKHAAPMAPRPLSEEAADTRHRGRADVLLLTGTGTGHPADPSQVEEIRAVDPTIPVFVASGVTEATAAHWSTLVDGAIVGSSIMQGGQAGQRIDPDRAKRLLEIWVEGNQETRRETMS